MKRLRSYYTSESFIEKMYGRTNIDRIIRSYLSKKNFSSEIERMISEIIRRRVEEFRLEPEELKEDIVSLVENLDEVSFEPVKDTPRYLGQYEPNKKKITINSWRFSRLAAMYGQNYAMERAFETLTHEVYHAMGIEVDRDHPNYGEDRFVHMDEFHDEYLEIALMETIVEVAADRTTMDRTWEDFKRHKKQTDGYSDLTFIVPVLANAFGVSERDFLKHGLRSREDLISFLGKKIGNYDYTRYGLNAVEFGLGDLHQHCYGKKQVDKEEKDKTLRIEIPYIYGEVYCIIKARLESNEFDSMNYSEEIEKLISAHNAITVLFNNQMMDFMGPLRNQISSSCNMLSYVVEVKKRIANLLTVDYLVKTGKTKVEKDSKEYMVIMDAIRKGKLNGREGELARALIGNNAPAERLTKILESGTNSFLSEVNQVLEEKRFVEDYNSEEMWDNEGQIKLMTLFYFKSKEEYKKRMARISRRAKLTKLNEPFRYIFGYGNASSIDDKER